MTSIQLISAILRGKWLVEPVFALTQGSVIASILNRQTEFEKKDINQNSCFAVSAKNSGIKYSWRDGFDRAPQNSIAVISLIGPLMKETQLCGPMGMAATGEIIQQADNHHNIDAIVLKIDSPGGTVDGTETLANIVKNTQKPTVAFVDGLMASAAMWIGSGANHIMTSTDTDEVGSIGVLMSFADFQPYWEAKGVKFHTITASTSTEKVKEWEELRKGNYDAYTKEILDPLDEKFMKVIRENRPNIEEKHLTGKVFFARDVMGILVDSTGTFQEAIQKAYELANPDNESDLNNNQNTKEMKQFKNVNNALGVETLEAIDDSVSLNEEQLNSLDTALADNDQKITDARKEAETERDQAIQDKKKVEETLNNATKALNEIDPSIAEAETPEEKARAIRSLLAEKPGAKPEGNHDKKDPEENPTVNGVDWKTMDKLKHNQEADNL